MDKSIVILRHEYQQALVDLTNKAGLPIFVMHEVVRSLADELKKMSDAELQRELARIEEVKANAHDDV